MSAKKRKSGVVDARREDGEGPIKLGETTLPLTRVRRLIKAQDDVHYVSAEASFLVSRATELFLELMTEAGVRMIGSRQEHSLQYSDLAGVVAGNDKFEFLRDIVPQKTSGAEVLGELRAAQKAAQ